MEGTPLESSQSKTLQTGLPTINTNATSYTTNPLLPKLGTLAPPLLQIYPSITQPATQPTQFKSRFLPKHQKERSPLSPDRSISSARFSRNPFVVKASLSSLRENEESSSPNLRQKANRKDKLTEQIQSFISRTDHVANDWQKAREQRAISVGPPGTTVSGEGAIQYDMERSMRFPPPATIRHAQRASSVAPNFGTSRPGGDLYGDLSQTNNRLFPPDVLQRRNTYHNSSREHSSRREFFSPDRSTVREFDYSFKNAPSVNPSVASRARRNPRFFTNGDVSINRNNLRPGGGRFMSLEDECNWILSGREPLPDDLNGLCDGDDDSDADDNTLDDISGDEVKRNSIEK